MCGNGHIGDALLLVQGIMTILEGERKSSYDGEWERNEAYGEGTFKSPNGDT